MHFNSFAENTLDTALADTLYRSALKMTYKNRQKADSLNRQLLKYSQQYGYVEGISNALCNFCMLQTIHGEADSAVYYCEESIKFAYKSKSIKLMARAHTYYANVISTYGKNKEAFIHYNKGLELYQKISHYDGIASAYHNMAIIHAQSGRSALAIDYFTKAINLKDKTGNKGLGTAYTSLAVIYSDIKNYSKAMYFLNEAVDLYVHKGDHIRVGHTLMSMANCLTDSGAFIQGFKKYKEALQVSKEYEFENNQNEIIRNLALWCLSVNELDPEVARKICKATNMPYNSLLDSAVTFALKAKNYEESATNIIARCDAYNILANTYLHSNNATLAEHYFEKAKHIASEHNYQTRLIESLDGLVKVNIKLGKIKSVNRYAIALLRFKDSIQNHQIIEISQRIEEGYKLEHQILQNQINDEQKNHEIKELNQQAKINNRNLIISITCVVLFALITLVLVLINRHKRQVSAREKEILEIKHTQLEQKVLRSQMNPHFISNSLTAIQAFILKNQSIQSASYLAKFAKLMRLIIESSRMDLISLEEELKILEYYLDLQKLRFDNKLDFNISIDDQLDIEEIKIPPMLLQPFIENAVEHGINKSEGKIDIQFKDNKDSILISIQDNGIGIASSRSAEHKDRKSYSTQITKERIENLNARNKKILSFKIMDLNKDLGLPENGTRIQFNIPYNLKILTN
ncbi:MAG: tetratricopeptide repeat protein [Flavobacteriales bacterium]|nr:tetratricopeptide repeat protein [Flavobacteriales bacterium]